VKTAKGSHYYFADTEGGKLGNREGKLGPYGINVRSGHGYVIAPGSRHASGITYTANGVRAIAPLPAWVRQAIQGKLEPTTDNGDGSKTFELPDVIKDGKRDDTLFKFASSLRGENLTKPTAKLLMQEAWKRCETPSTAKTEYTWDEALGKLEGAYDRYDAPAEKQEKKSASTLLVELALDRYRFGCTEDGQPFAVTPGGHVVRMLRGGKNSVRAELSQVYYWRHHKAAPQQALADALLVLEGEALAANPSEVHLRVAAADNAIWLDLGDTTETVIRINGDGWEIRDTAPVLFRRTSLTGVLPTPDDELRVMRVMRVTNPDLLRTTTDKLWKQLNVAEPDRPLVLACLVAAIANPNMPHPILSLSGEQGTAKSTTTKRIVELLDPSPVPLRKPPKDPESWVIAAQGSWVVALDNMSTVPDWLSDCLCRAVTGDGDVCRALYTDSELSVFGFRRCIILNGIDLGACAATWSTDSSMSRST
jgi:hypothetical protein